MPLRSLLRFILGSLVAQGATCTKPARQLAHRSAVSPQDPCPAVVEAYKHSNLTGLAVPYRVARSSYGLGLFALRRVRKGELVWRYNPQEMVRLTEGNWRQVTEQLIRQRSWQDDPELDKAFAALAIEGRAAGELPEQLLGLYLRKVQNYIVSYRSKDGNTDYVLLPLGDSNYFNYAKMAAGERSVSFLQRRGFGTVVADAEAPEADLIDKEPMFARRDIEPCTELLEDYAWSDDDSSRPEWMMQVFREHGGVISGFDDTSGKAANIG